LLDAQRKTVYKKAITGLQTLYWYKKAEIQARLVSYKGKYVRIHQLYHLKISLAATVSNTLGLINELEKAAILPCQPAAEVDALN